jgi:aconitase A
VQLVETYAKAAGLWADALVTAQYERVLRFDLSTVVRNMAGPSNPHARLPTSATGRTRHRRRAKLEAAARGSEGLMPDGAVIIAAITSAPTPATRAT